MARATAGSFDFAQDRLFDCGGKSAAFAQDDNFSEGDWREQATAKAKATAGSFGYVQGRLFAVELRRMGQSGQFGGPADLSLLICLEYVGLITYDCFDCAL
jgi:hypothetical protein